MIQFRSSDVCEERRQLRVIPDNKIKLSSVSGSLFADVFTAHEPSR